MEFGVGESGLVITKQFQDASNIIWTREELIDLHIMCLRFGKMKKKFWPELSFREFLGGNDSSVNYEANRIIIRRNIPMAIIHETAHMLAFHFHKERWHAFIFKYYLQNLILYFQDHVLEFDTKSGDIVSIPQDELYELVRKAKL